MTTYRTPVAERVATLLPYGERRGGGDRRRRPDRRAQHVQVTPESRYRPRRSGRERRETAGGHVRNAIQLLGAASAFGSSNEEERAALEAAQRRLWLALREIELGNPGDNSPS